MSQSMNRRQAMLAGGCRSPKNCAQPSLGHMRVTGNSVQQYARGGAVMPVKKALRKMINEKNDLKNNNCYVKGGLVTKRMQHRQNIVDGTNSVLLKNRRKIQNEVGEEYGLGNYTYQKEPQRMDHCGAQSAHNIAKYAIQKGVYHPKRKEILKDAKKQYIGQLGKEYFEKNDPNFALPYQAMNVHKPLYGIKSENFEDDEGQNTESMLMADGIPSTTYVNDFSNHFRKEDGLPPLNKKNNYKLNRAVIDLTLDKLKNKNVPNIHLHGEDYPVEGPGAHSMELSRMHLYPRINRTRSREGSLDFSDPNYEGKVRGVFNARGDVKTIHHNKHFNVGNLSGTSFVPLNKIRDTQEKLLKKRIVNGIYKKPKQNKEYPDSKLFSDKYFRSKYGLNKLK